MRKHAAKEHCFFSQGFKNDNNCFCLILVFMLQADGKSMRKKEIHVIWAWGLHKWHCTKGLLLPNSHPDRAEWSPTGRNKPSSKFCGTGTVSLMTSLSSRAAGVRVSASKQAILLHHQGWINSSKDYPPAAGTFRPGLWNSRGVWSQKWPRCSANIMLKPKARARK